MTAKVVGGVQFATSARNEGGRATLSLFDFLLAGKKKNPLVIVECSTHDM